jgi:hypothetical protein
MLLPSGSENIPAVDFLANRLIFTTSSCLTIAGERQLTATNSEEPRLRYVRAWLCEDHLFPFTIS